MENYNSSFENFLRCADEKEISLKILSRYFRELKVKSILDIGAGNGDFALKLSKLVKRYLAIDQNNDFVERLKALNLEAIKADFPQDPLNIDENFDAVLCSYVIPHDSDFNKFIDKAVCYLGSKKHLIIVTHRRSKDEWGELCGKCGLTNYWDEPMFFEEFTTYLKNTGKLSIEDVIVHLRSKNIEEFIAALAFIASAGRKDKEIEFYSKKDEITKIINRDNFKNGIYEFKLKHFFLIVEKN